jgi:molecular chaperone DnaK (HSP70)
VPAYFDDAQRTATKAAAETFRASVETARDALEAAIPAS